MFYYAMLLVVLGFLLVVLAWTDAATQKIVHDLLFILGYALMLVGMCKVKNLKV